MVALFDSPREITMFQFNYVAKNLQRILLDRYASSRSTKKKSKTRGAIKHATFYSTLAKPSLVCALHERDFLDNSFLVCFESFSPGFPTSLKNHNL